MCPWQMLSFAAAVDGVIQSRAVIDRCPTLEPDPPDEKGLGYLTDVVEVEWVHLIPDDIENELAGWPLAGEQPAGADSLGRDVTDSCTSPIHEASQAGLASLGAPSSHSLAS